MPQPQRPADLSAIPTSSIRERASRLRLETLGAPPDASASAMEFMTTLPKTGLAWRLNEAAREVREAARRDHPVVALVGHEVLAAGYSPLLVSLMERGVLAAVALDGRSALFDFELAYYGHTDEDPVGPGYGSAREVGETFNLVVNEGVARGFGLGEFLGRSLLERSVRHVEYSILAHGAAKRIPTTVHPLIGADPVHRYATASGASYGKGAHRDFALLTGQLPALHNGGIVLDLWSGGLGGVFEQAIATARQSVRQVLGGWHSIEFRSANTPQIPHPWTVNGDVRLTQLPGDPLLLSLFHLGVAAAE